MISTARGEKKEQNLCESCCIFVFKLEDKTSHRLNFASQCFNLVEELIKDRFLCLWRFGYVHERISLTKLKKLTKTIVHGKLLLG